MKIHFTNTNIWSDQSSDLGYKSQMIIEDNLIFAIGDECEGIKVDKIIDLTGKYIFPGLIDSHIHLYGLARSKIRLLLDKPKSISEMQNLLLEYDKNNPELPWLIGYDWDQDYMEDGRYPNRHDIDLIVKDRPVVLFRSCNHIGVLNTLALKELGISDDTSDPVGGAMDRDDEGKPSGILRETALGMVTPYIKIKDKKLIKKLLLMGIEECLKSGLTSVQTNDAYTWDIYKEIDDEMGLPIRVALTIYHNEIAEYNSPMTNSDNLWCDRVKLFTDGSLGAQTAALREPYHDSGEVGIPIYSQEELNKKVKIAKDNDFRLEIHAIGDSAAEITLNAFHENSISSKDRAILTHAQVLGRDLIVKMKSMDIIANIQPSFVKTDSRWVDNRLGKSERLDYAYAWKTLLDEGIKISGGSDSPIETENPLIGMYDAIYRKNTEGKVWKKEQRLTFNEALELYTKGGAYSMQREEVLGRLEKNQLADFIILDTDIANNSEKLPDTKVLETWVNGKKSYSKNYSNDYTQ